MNDEQLCDCTVHCTGAQSCALGTWVLPEPATAQAMATGALLNLGDWLHSEQHTTIEIVSAIFDSIPFSEDPSKIDLFAAFTQAMNSLGFESTDSVAVDAVWYLTGTELKREQATRPLYCPPDECNPVSLRNVTSLTEPTNFHRVFEFMATLNFLWICRGYPRTSEITAMFFPGVSKEVQDSWLTEAIDTYLYMQGYAPESATGDDKAGVFDDPEWFIPGDPGDAIRQNLWKGKAVQENTSLMATHSSS